MQDTEVFCPECGADVGGSSPAYCPACRSPLIGQRQAVHDRSVADPFGDWPGTTEPAADLFPDGPALDYDPFATPGSPPSRSKRSRRALSALAVIGVITLIRLGPSIWDGITGAFGGPERDNQGEVVDSGVTSAFDIRVGDCFNVAEEVSESVEQAELIPCAQPHMFEAYADYVYSDPDQASYPGEAAIVDLAGAFCLEQFETFVDQTWETSELDFAYLYPQLQGWRYGDRTILCIVQTMDGSLLTGSMRGAGI